ncbi:hypothetical protein JOF29_005437 [Kribbella aluminosa]|uniref:Uncharacterized protein n=1 Tax=Kribbella aluminosa TaxID=416017 RepID=A0ABS4URQ9_9ACTN|nr:hypothetical protein [Kribbella aluminosa]MBP2354327.1 hypothetical protein [Kribbella aluminosa]
MPKLTDEELGTLLRETFADREARIGRGVLDDHHAPTATKHRTAMPVMLAAAMVLVVLAGVLYGVQRLQQTGTTAPAAAVTATASPAVYSTRDADIWGLAVGQLIRTSGNPRPTPSAPETAVLVDSPSTAPGRVRPGAQFSSNQRVIIKSHLIRIAQLTVLDRTLPQSTACTTYPKAAVLQVSDVLDKGDHLEVDVAMTRPGRCTEGVSARYRVEPRDAHWVITRNLGPWNR